MSLIEDFAEHMKGNNSNNVDESQLPWTTANNNEDQSSKNVKSLSTKKLATIGLSLIIIIISAIAMFNFINSNKSINVDQNNNDELKSELRKIQVHVAGEVNKPGVYKLDEGSRIMDAVTAAGGFTAKADQNSLNLAKVLEDGEQILINSVDASLNQSSQSNSATNNGKVNINTADLTLLQTLNGVGPSTAQKIIDYRNANGKFKAIEDLKKVSGIGDKTFEKFKDQICV